MNASVRPPTVNATASYRPFLDGLRAVSIIAVIFYHSKVAWITGGFVGVDVFFVISGYLIIGQIVAGLEAGNFSLADFWARRVWRILPPFLLVLVATTIAAPFALVLPDAILDFGKQAQNAATMTINLLFFARQG